VVAALTQVGVDFWVCQCPEQPDLVPTMPHLGLTTSHGAQAPSASRQLPRVPGGGGWLTTPIRLSRVPEGKRLPRNRLRGPVDSL
jgi:hypothetical protein